VYTWRFYRRWTGGGLNRFRILAGESDLEIAAGDDCMEEACVLLRRARLPILRRIRRDPHFETSLAPIQDTRGSEEPVASMLRASRLWDVGPMAAVAGAISGFVGRGLAKRHGTVIVENGGDIYARGPEELVLRLYAGESSPFRGSVDLAVEASDGIGICTSSGTVGPSLSLGRADAVTVVASDPAVADAAATSIANRVGSQAEVDAVLKAAAKNRSILGALACCGGRLAVYGLRLLQPIAGGCS